MVIRTNLSVAGVHQLGQPDSLTQQLLVVRLSGWVELLVRLKVIRLHVRRGEDQDLGHAALKLTPDENRHP